MQFNINDLEGKKFSLQEGTFSGPTNDADFRIEQNLHSKMDTFALLPSKKPNTWKLGFGSLKMFISLAKPFSKKFRIIPNSRFFKTEQIQVSNQELCKVKQEKYSCDSSNRMDEDLNLSDFFPSPIEPSSCKFNTQPNKRIGNCKFSYKRNKFLKSKRNFSMSSLRKRRRLYTSFDDTLGY